MERRILHADFNSFYASVACFLDPGLRPHPVAVAGDPEKRHGIILAKNELAKKFGVKTGEAVWQARQKCPRLITVAPDFAAYEKFSVLGRQLYGEYSDRVESFGPDESWIDVSQSTSSFAEAARLAETIRLRVHEELGITVSVGVAANKVFAKLGSDLKKPDAVTLISPENYKERIWPLPVRELLYVGRATEEKLRHTGITTIGALANTPEALLKAQLGKSGMMLHAFANGQDASPVRLLGDEAPPKSVGNGVTAPYDLVTDADVYLTVMMLCESVCARLRAQCLRARTVQLSMRDTALYTFMRQRRLEPASDLTAEFAHAAMALYKEHYRQTCPLRSLTVTATDLIGNERPAQLSLFGNEAARLRAAQAEQAVDDIRRRFGYHAIGRAMYLADARIGQMNPREEHTMHPTGYLQNGTMSDVIGQK